MRMSVEKRRDEIIGLFKTRDSIRVSVLAQHFDVSEVVVRKDLKCLEELGIVRRFHGGATRIGQGYLYKDLDERMSTRGEQKRRIAKVARSLVGERTVLMLNSGSTNLYIARELVEIGDLVVVTNAIRAASELARTEAVHAILLGGQVKEKYQFTYGHDTLKQLGKYHADTCFISVDGIDAACGLTSYYHYEAEIIRQMMSQSSRTIIAADSSKIGKTSLEVVGKVQNVNILITDAEFPNKDLAAIRDAGVEIRHA